MPLIEKARFTKCLFPTQQPSAWFIIYATHSKAPMPSTSLEVAEQGVQRSCIAEGPCPASLKSEWAAPMSFRRISTSCTSTSPQEAKASVRRAEQRLNTRQEKGGILSVLYFSPTTWLYNTFKKMKKLRPTCRRCIKGGRGAALCVEQKPFRCGKKCQPPF